MSTPYFSQNRCIDPFSSYYSNIVNQLSRMITRGVDCLHSARSMDINVSDSTSVIMIPGFLFKDDVLIENTSNFSIDFTDSQMYLDFGAGFNEAGYYAITVNYVYAKSKPAPQAKIQIFKPSQRNLINSSCFFLKSVYVIFNGVTFEVQSVHDFDSTFPLQKRVYSQVYVGTEDTKPSFDEDRDEARIIYVRDEDEIYFGASDCWINIRSIRDTIDTSNCTLKQLGYVKTDGKVHPAIASSVSTFADCVVVGVGTVSSGDGKAKLYGRVDNVHMESGRTITPGENVYLSKTEPGKITDLVPEPNSQYVGTCVGTGDSISTCHIWFMPGSEGGSGEFGQSLYDRYQDLLLSSIYKKLTVDSFLNTDRIDLVNTTAVLDTIHYEIDGSVGETFRSTDLVEVGYDGTCLISCQISAESLGNLTWYASNNGGIEWEQVELDDIHTFATNELPVDSAGAFEIGEIIVGNVSGVTAILNANYGTYLLIRNLTSSKTFTNGETITGQTSGVTKTAGVQTDREFGYVDLRVRCDFNSDGSIDDYGVLYDLDEALVPSNFEDNERNIQTLFSDIYESPSIDNDGLPNLTTPIETCKDNIQEFIGSEGDYDTTPPYTSTSIIDSTASLVTAISQLDSKISDNNISLTNVSRTITDGDTTPSILDDSGVRCGLLITNNSASTIITNFDDALHQITFSLLFNDNDTTVANNANILLQGEADFEGRIYDIITFRKTIYGWIEIARRTGSGTINITGYGIFNVGDATPDIIGYKNWYTNSDSTSVIITNFQNSREGDEITIFFTDNNTTISNNANIVLSGGSSFNGNIGDSISLVYTSGVWSQKGISSGSSYLYTKTVAGDPWSINHGLRQRICQVMVTDDAGNKIIPNDILFDDENNLTITFLVNQAGYARISK